MSRVTSKPKKQQSPSKLLRCKIKPGTNEEVCLNYLIMRSRSKTLKARVEDVFLLSPDRFKTNEVVRKALDNLVAYSYATLSSDQQYEVTELGKTIPYIMVEHRKQKNRNSKDD